MERDWRYGDCLGLESNIDAPNNSTGWSCPSSTWKSAMNDLTVKMGHYAA